MAIRIGRKIPNWLILAIAATVVMAGLILSSLFRPLPEYLVAAKDIVPGEPITEGDFSSVAADLGSIETYVSAIDLPIGQGVVRVVRKGELLSSQDLTSLTDAAYTAIRLTPELKPAVTSIGSSVSVWRAIERESGTELELIVPKAELTALEYGQGLFAKDNPEVQLRLTLEEAIAVMHAVSLENKIYVVPVQ